MATLYVRINDVLHEEIANIARDSGVSMREVVEILLSERVGLNRPHAALVVDTLAYKARKRNGIEK